MPKKYIPFSPEPIGGQAVLSNFNRILKYRGASDAAMVLERGMPLYELEKLETVGENAGGNLLIRGECVSACAYLKEQGTQVDLVYIDPPFASGADYAKKIYIRRSPKIAAEIAAAEQELDMEELKAFEEKMYGDVWDKEKYLNWMYENLTAIKSVMSETASIYVHLDWHIGHYGKILLDEVFGEDNFRNEIVWQKLKAAKKQAETFGNLHDTIFYYSKNGERYLHNKQHCEYSKALIDAHYSHTDTDGRRYTDDSFTQTGRGPSRDFGKWGVLEPPAGKHWIWSQEKIDEGLKNGSIIFTSRGTPRVKRYLDERAGMAVGDIWTDIFPINSQAAETEDYVTQKPEALLERIIKASSNENMLVADFFGGSGVAAAVANKLRRRFIHCDIGINSIQTARDRLAADGAAFDVLEIKDGVSLYRNPVQTMDKIKSLIPGLKHEHSLDSFWEGAISDSKLGTVPVYVPNLMDSGTKLLDVVLMNRIIHQAIPDLDANIKKVIVYYADITSEEEIRKFIAEDDSAATKIELRDLKTILDDVIAEDYARFSVETTQDDLFGGYAIGIETFQSDRVQSKIAEFNNKAMFNASPQKPYKPIEISGDGLELIEFLSADCTAGDGEWHSDSEIKIDKLGYVVKKGEKTKELWDGKIRCQRRPLRFKIRNICGDESVWAVGTP
ncbi:hypothetical protein FACS1894191_0150 [Clostridia bacterium]|nr:hypothetical protein FACS1894191_0150 [Clostridia bacterium]